MIKIPSDHDIAFLKTLLVSGYAPSKWSGGVMKHLIAKNYVRLAPIEEVVSDAKSTMGFGGKTYNNVTHVHILTREAERSMLTLTVLSRSPQQMRYDHDMVRVTIGGHHIYKNPLVNYPNAILPSPLIEWCVANNIAVARAPRDTKLPSKDQILVEREHQVLFLLRWS